jgi:hypothetical protein
MEYSSFSCLNFVVPFLIIVAEHFKWGKANIALAFCLAALTIVEVIFLIHKKYPKSKREWVGACVCILLKCGRHCNNRYILYQPIK